MDMEKGCVHRLMAETYCEQDKYKVALKCANKFYEIAKEEDNQVEIQRAHATLARCHLLKA